MAKAPVRPVPAPDAPDAKAAGDPFDHLAEMLRTLFAGKLQQSAACPACGDYPCTCDDEAEAEPRRLSPFGEAGSPKGMRRVSISILMPMASAKKKAPASKA